MQLSVQDIVPIQLPILLGFKIILLGNYAGMEEANQYFMSINELIITLILISIPQSLVVNILAAQLLGIYKKEIIKQLILVGLIDGLISFTVYMLRLPYGLHMVVNLFLFIFVAQLLLGIHMNQAVYLTITAYAAALIFESGVVAVMLFITGLSLDELIDNFNLRLTFTCTGIMLAGGAVYWLISRNIRIAGIEKVADFTKSYGHSIFIAFIQIALLGVVFIYSRLQSPSYFNLIKAEVFWGIAGGLFLILNIWLILSLTAAVQRETILLANEAYMKNIEELFLNYRSQRHDLSNHFQTLNSLLKANKIEKALDYLKDLNKETVATNMVLKFGNPVLVALLQVKIAKAEQKSILLDLFIGDELTHIALQSFELVKLVGNLLDNALEAAENSTIKQKKVSFETKNYNRLKVICIRNYGIYIDPDIMEKIFEPGFSTKDGHSGIGLSICRSLVEKYRGNIEVYNVEEGTMVEVTVASTVKKS
ncbi:signal transduction histidine kinase regulating citrate/malate metabolism [Desulfofarcimen acetoxidans DSM 771]|uniref:histidine kinase n=2 Tax=Desulfofarcimen acetoxidans TaxID=58138 RepID=C8W4Z2_DESAS|nr:signal transduction histidine kinase regulating citrate/malate metabolism [Desulfofarcimen acetoxidans DSM 771]